MNGVAAFWILKKRHPVSNKINILCTQKFFTGFFCTCGSLLASAKLNLIDLVNFGIQSVSQCECYFSGKRNIEGF